MKPSVVVALPFGAGWAVDWVTRSGGSCLFIAISIRARWNVTRVPDRDRRARPGQTCILALTAAFRGDPYPAWVETEDEQLSFVLVAGAMFRQLCNAEPPFRSFVFEVLSGRVFELMSRAGTVIGRCRPAASAPVRV